MRRAENVLTKAESATFVHNITVDYQLALGGPAGKTCYTIADVEVNFPCHLALRSLLRSSWQPPPRSQPPPGNQESWQERSNRQQDGLVPLTAAVGFRNLRVDHSMIQTYLSEVTETITAAAAAAAPLNLEASTDSAKIGWQRSRS